MSEKSIGPEDLKNPQEEIGEEIDQELLELCEGDQELAKKVQETRRKYKREWWKSENSDEIVWGQLNEPVLIVALEKFHEAAKKVFGEPICTDELGLNAERLKAEFKEKTQGKYSESFLNKIIEMIPKEKRVVIESSGKNKEN